MAISVITHSDGHVATFRGYFQGASIEDLSKYFSGPGAAWEPEDLYVPADVVRKLLQAKPSEQPSKETP